MTALFKPNGDGYDITAPGVLLLMAGVIREADPEESTPQGRALALRMVKDLLAAARAGGYAQTEILETMLLCNGETSKRVSDMAVQACAAAGDPAIERIFAAMRKGRTA